jgi:DNA-directed RNA polymerase III subunit RPC2
VGKPSIEENMTTRDVTPHECRLRDLTYSAVIMVDIKFRKEKTTVTKKGVAIGRMPIMLRSSKCVLSGKTPAQLAKAGECEIDSGTQKFFCQTGSCAHSSLRRLLYCERC